MVNQLLTWWEINDPLPERIDAVVAISYGATADDLTLGSSLVARIAKRIAMNSRDRNPEMLLFWGTFSKNPRKYVEMHRKSDIFQGFRTAFVGDVSSTTEECQRIRGVMLEIHSRQQNIVVVTEGCHSRRVKRVWEYFFPNSNIYFKSIDPRDAEDAKNPMILQRYWWSWFLVNFLLYPFYLGNGVKRMARLNFSQPT